MASITSLFGSKNNTNPTVQELAQQLGINTAYEYSVIIKSAAKLEDIASAVQQAGSSITEEEGATAIKAAGNVYDITDVTQKIVITSRRDGSATVCEIDFKLPYLEIAPWPPGSLIIVKILNVDPTKAIQFIGYEFEISRNQWGDARIVAYDSMRYLQNSIYVFKPAQTKGSEIITEAITQCGLNTSMSTDFNIDYHWQNMPFIQYAKPAIDLINWVLNRSVATNEIKDAYFIRSDYNEPSGKTIKFGYCKDNKTNYVLGKNSLLIDFKIVCSIDEQTYNSIELIYDDGKELQRLEAATVNAPLAQKQYGLLKLVKQFNDTWFCVLSSGQWKSAEGAATGGDANARLFITEWAKSMLEFYCRPFYTLQMTTLGVPGLRAGDIVKIDIPGMGIGSNKEWNDEALVDEVIHTFEESIHTMDIVVTVGCNEKTDAL